MNLTRLRLDPRNAQARRDLGDPYELHRTLVRAFVCSDEQTPPRFLWRAEPVTSWSEPVVLVQSVEPAEWSVLEAQTGYLKGEVESRQLVPEQWLQGAEHFRFRLFANPTVTRDGKRLGLLTEETQLAWLARQGERLGFVPETVLVTGSEMLRGRKGESRISLLKVCFEGRLRVTHPATLAQAMRVGIGPGKAFGCGLLSLGRG